MTGHFQAKNRTNMLLTISIIIAHSKSIGNTLSIGTSIQYLKTRFFP